jgi:hypothetical protein
MIVYQQHGVVLVLARRRRPLPMCIVTPLGMLPSEARFPGCGIAGVGGRGRDEISVSRRGLPHPVGFRSALWIGVVSPCGQSGAVVTSNQLGNMRCSRQSHYSSHRECTCSISIMIHYRRRRDCVAITQHVTSAYCVLYLCSTTYGQTTIHTSKSTSTHPNPHPHIQIHIHIHKSTSTSTNPHPHPQRYSLRLPALVPLHLHQLRPSRLYSPKNISLFPCLSPEQDVLLPHPIGVPHAPSHYGPPAHG